MGFDARAFARADLSPRQQSVPVPELAAWFGEGEAVVFRMRGLSADELARAKDAHANNLRRLGMLDALTGQSRAEVASDVRAALGAEEDKHPDIAMRQELVHLGTAEPALSEETVALLAERYPLLLYRLSNVVNTLTGQGPEAKKKPNSSTPKPMSDSA